MVEAGHRRQSAYLAPKRLSQYNNLATNPSTRSTFLRAAANGANLSFLCPFLPRLHHNILCSCNPAERNFYNDDDVMI